ncbi:MAG: hypothetical protein ACRCZ0_09340 [Cetobacterium sp.]
MLNKKLIGSLFILTICSISSSQPIHGDCRSGHAQQRECERNVNSAEALRSIQARNGWLVNTQTRNGQTRNVYEGRYQNYSTTRWINFRLIEDAATGNVITVIRLDYIPTRSTTRSYRRKTWRDRDELRV